MRHYLCPLVFILVTLQAFPQSYKFRKYVEQDGLNNRFVYTINQDEMGNLLVGTGEGLYRYDGFAFKEVSEEQGLTDNFLACSTTAADGSIWYGHNKGLVTRYNSGKFEQFDVSSFTQSRINSIYEDKNKTLWVLTQNDGVLKKGSGNTWTQFIKGIEDITLYSFYVDDYNKLWLGTDMGLLYASITDQGNIEYDFVEEVIETKVSAILHTASGLIIGTEDSGIFQVNVLPTGYMVAPLSYHGNNFATISVNSLFEDPERNLWISSNNKGLIQLTGLVGDQYLKMIHYQDSEQIKTTSMKVSFADREGTIWIGTMGDGLLKLTDNYFSIYSFPETERKPDVFAVYEKNDTIWSGGYSKLFMSFEEPAHVIDSLDARNGLPESEITSIYKDEKGTLWVGTLNGLLLKMPAGKDKFLPMPLSSEHQAQRVNDILGYNNALYVATDYGIYQFSDERLVSHISIQSGLSHNVVKSLYRDSKGKIWIATNNSQVTYIEDGIIKNIEAPIQDILIQIRCIAEDNSGNIWIGTDGLGVMKITGDEIYMLNKSNGLYSDYCYSVVCDHRNKLWVGHHGAISQVNVLNNHIEILDPGNGFDIDFNDNAVDRTPSGIILFGVNEGVLRYEPDKDLRNDKEPIMHMNSILVNDSLCNQNIITLGYAEYKLRFEFIGVSLKNPLKVTYQYYLEGYETDWCSPTTANVKDYSKIGPGEYTFKVKCTNSDGFGGTTILEIKIFVDKPFWMKWWFIALCVLLIILIVRFIILRRERYLRENQERLKKALDERTKEVVEQKELLEEKNKDITDSIQYARNIQKAMLPPVDSLKTYFDDAFVYYKPRDIVSGDFYWVEKFDQTIVVSCADCTGHGVPGAFMSLIGSTLLKEVSSKKVVQSSRDVLIHLDGELRRMLNKQGDLAIEDGMDIVVFDYHLDTSTLKIASANRPIIFYHKGEWLDLKGDRQSIGGSKYTTQKEFNLYEFQVEKGDMIYLFSDGITDQFGGVDGKKLKRSGLINWIKSVAHENMDEQRKTIRQRFHEWKNEKEQIDDIIIIGIRF